MIVEYVRYRIEPSESEAFEAAYQTAARSLDAAPQCLSYELTRGFEDPDRYVLRIEWTSVTDHEHDFRAGPEFASFFDAIGPYVGSIEEMKHYQRTEVVSA